MLATLGPLLPKAKCLPIRILTAWQTPTGFITSSVRFQAVITPESGDRTLRHPRKIGFKHASRRRPADRVMSCLLTQSPSTFPAVTWRSIGGRSKAWAASIPNTAKPGTMSISAGASNRRAGSLRLVQPRLSGIIDGSPFARSSNSRTVTARQNLYYASASHLFRTDRHSEMARPDLWRDAVQLVRQSSGDLSRDFR